MRLQERSYTTKAFRPKPQFVIDEAAELAVISTGWGASEVVGRVNQLLMDSVKQNLDVEATRVGPIREALNESVFQLKYALNQANEFILNSENKSEYQVIVESAVISRKGSVLSWAQVGGPNIFVSNPKGLQPVAYELDWAWQRYQGSPLACYGLGLERNCQINSGSVILSEERFLAFLGRSYVPSDFFAFNTPDLSAISKTLVSENAEVPFWLGVMSF